MFHRLKHCQGEPYNCVQRQELMEPELREDFIKEMQDIEKRKNEIINFKFGLFIMNFFANEF